MSVIVTQSLHKSNEFYVFRPLGNESHREIKFHIIEGEIKEDKFNKLKDDERIFIELTIL